MRLEHAKYKNQVVAWASAVLNACLTLLTVIQTGKDVFLLLRTWRRTSAASGRKIDAVQLFAKVLVWKIKLSSEAVWE